MRRSLALLGAVALGATACAATPRAHTDIGLARVGLTLAFSDKALQNAPVPPQIIIQLIPAPPSLQAEKVPSLAPFVVPNNLPTNLPAPQLPQLCPKAPAGATVPEASPLLIAKPPAPGYYRLYNTGSIKVTADGFTFQFPYPIVTTMQVTPAKTTTVDTVPGVPSAGTSQVTTFQEITTLTPTDVITETYQYNTAEMDLVSRSETNAGSVNADAWSPPVKEYSTSGVGTSWQALGSDVARNNVMAFQGAINSSKVVDACGSLIDTMEVTGKTTIVNTQSQQQSGTTPGASDIYDVATSIGGLFASRHLNQTLNETVKNAPVVIVTNVVSVLDGLTPSKTPPPPLGQ